MTPFTALFPAPAPVATGIINAIPDPDVPTPVVAPPADDTALPLLNLNTLGYERAEQHRGNALALDNLLNRVLRGYLTDEGNDDDRRKRHHATVDGQILTLEKQAETARTDSRKITDTELPALRHSMEQLDEEIRQIRSDEAAGLRNPNHRDRAQLWLYGGLVLLLTVFVYLFYVSAFYSAFYRDLAGELQRAGTDGQAGVMAAIFARSAFSTFDFHWAGPLLLFSFGGFLHVLTENKTTVGRLMLGTLVLVILGTDGLIAFFVESKNHEMKLLMGLADANDHAWWMSPVFWLVMAMGFVAALVWSGLLHAWMHEIGKKDVARITALEIRHRQEKQIPLKAQINALNTTLADLGGQMARIELEINALKASREAVVFSPSELEKYVTDFYDGWLTYVNNRMGNDAALREGCDAVLKRFYANHLGNEQQDIYSPSTNQPL